MQHENVKTRANGAMTDPNLVNQMATHLAQHGRPEAFYVVGEPAARPLFRPTITSRRQLRHVDPEALTRKPIVVVVVEKPMHADCIAPLIAARWPKHDVLFVLTYTFGLSRLELPAPSATSVYPRVGEPVWQFLSAFPSAPVWVPHGEDVVPTDLPVEVALGAADEIILACEADSTGAIACHTLLQECLSVEAAHQLRRVVALTALDDTSLEAAYSAGLTTLDPEYQGWLATGLARRFFDFNYNANALAVQGPVLACLGVNSPNGLVSKYALQVLYHLRTRARRAMKERDVLEFMACGFSTPGYARTPIGSALSRFTILESLKVAGLIEKDGLDCYWVTPQGEAFLSALPAKCEDPALPAKLAAWTANWPTSRGEMEAYLLEFFNVSE